MATPMCSSIWENPSAAGKSRTAVELCQYLLDEALISTVPGEAYNVPGKIRISYPIRWRTWRKRWTGWNRHWRRFTKQ